MIYRLCIQHESQVDMIWVHDSYCTYCSIPPTVQHFPWNCLLLRTKQFSFPSQCLPWQLLRGSSTYQSRQIYRCWDIQEMQSLTACKCHRQSAYPPTGRFYHKAIPAAAYHHCSFEQRSLQSGCVRFWSLASADYPVNQFHVQTLCYRRLFLCRYKLFYCRQSKPLHQWFQSCRLILTHVR